MGLFDRRPKIFKSRDVLTPIFVPDTLQDREHEVTEISQYLGYLLEDATPPHLIIMGPPGCGKTVSVKYVLNELQQHADVLVNYIIADGTAYQVVTALAKSCECDVPLKGLGFNEIWNILKEELTDRRAIFVLDELDKTLAKDGTKLLYHLSRHPNICLIGISNKLTVMDMIDDLRVTSSFNPKKVPFPPYDANQLRDILDYRAERAFNPDVLDGSVIPLSAALAAQRNGDARYALDLLSFAADICIRQGNSKVTEENVRLATDEVEIEFIRRSINMLGENQKILLFCILTVGDRTPTNIYRNYNMKAKDLGSSPLTHRRLSALLRELELMGFVEIERRGKGRARGVEWQVYPPSTIDRETMLEVISRSL